jgi:hypothetical protein
MTGSGVVFILAQVAVLRKLRVCQQARTLVSPVPVRDNHKLTLAMPAKLVNLAFIKAVLCLLSRIMFLIAGRLPVHFAFERLDLISPHPKPRLARYESKRQRRRELANSVEPCKICERSVPSVNAVLANAELGLRVRVLEDPLERAVAVVELGSLDRKGGVLPEGVENLGEGGVIESIVAGKEDGKRKRRLREEERVRLAELGIV